MANEKTPQTSDSPQPTAPAIPTSRRALFWLLLAVLLGLYGFYSFGAFRVAAKGMEYLRNGKPATARAAFTFVLDRQTFSLAVPVARAALLSNVPAAEGGENRIAVWGFEHMLDESLGDSLQSAVNAAGIARSSEKRTAVFTPLLCDFGPLFALTVGIAVTVILTLLVFFRKPTSLSRRLFGLMVAVGVALWVCFDPFLGIRAELMQGSDSVPFLLAYDYPKYLFSLLFLILVLRQCCYLRIGGKDETPEPTPVTAAETTK